VEQLIQGEKKDQRKREGSKATSPKMRNKRGSDEMRRNGREKKEK